MASERPGQPDGAEVRCGCDALARPNDSIKKDATGLVTDFDGGRGAAILFRL